MKRIFILLLVLFFVHFCGKIQEPNYEGKSLSSCVKDLKDASNKTQKKAQEALIKIGEPSIPHMVKILNREKNNAVKVRAAYVLSSIGKGTKDEVSTLIKIIKTEKEESDLLFASARALVNIKPNAQLIIPDMVDLVKNGTQSQRIISAQVLGEMRNEAKEDIIKLINEIKEKDRELAKQLVKAIYSSIIEDIEKLDEYVNGNWDNLENLFIRRFDLIPNYLTIIKRYAPKEEKICNQVNKARLKIEAAKTISEKIFANKELTTALENLNIAIDKYQSIRRDVNFIRLLDEFAGTRNRIAIDKRRYNDVVKKYNEKIKNIPFPELFDFKPAVLF